MRELFSVAGSIRRRKKKLTPSDFCFPPFHPTPPHSIRDQNQGERDTQKSETFEDHPPRARAHPQHFIHIIIIRHQLSSCPSIIPSDCKTEWHQNETNDVNNQQQQRYEKCVFDDKKKYLKRKKEKHFFEKGKIASNYKRFNDKLN